MLRERVVTAVILFLLVGAGILWLPEIGSAVLFAVLVLLAAWEWAALCDLRSTLARMGFVALTLLLLGGVTWYCQLFGGRIDLPKIRDVLGLGCLWWAVALLWVKGFPASAVIWRSTAMRILMGWLTLVPAWAAMVYLRGQQYGVALIFILIALVAAADIGAYFTGRAWGRSKLAPRVSPGKSWAGFWGGMIVATALAVVLWAVFVRVMDRGIPGVAAVIVIAIATALASVLGDLLESMVKRQQGVKDSGTLLPGHGGILDRVDSLTAAAPVFALCLILAG